MTVVSLKIVNSRKTELLEAEFSDGSRLLFSGDYLPEDMKPDSRNHDSWNYNSLEGRDLAAWEEEAFRFAARCYLAEKAALRLIARAEQNSLGLTAKLERRGYDASVVKAVISRLLGRNLLNDERYAELWIRSCLARKTQSPLWLLASLQKRGIDRDTAKRTIKKVLDEETEYSLLLKYIEKIDILDNNIKNGSKTKLKCEGFSPEILNRFFDSI